MTLDIKKDYLIYPIIKRIFDVLVSIVSLIILSPIFLLIILAIKMESKGSAFYKHKRIGKNGQTIYLYKFRSMYSDSKEKLEEMLKDPKIRKEWEENFKLENDPRITIVGKILRRSSLDELPQLLNILNGDMSLVGPRPVIDSEIEKYGNEKDKFLSVTPGLTGWWACNGRSCTSYEDRKKLELYYIDHRGILLDLKIIGKTFISVIQKNGAK
ncbi:MAG: sugar transferase [Bacilli bacterium]|nr:sugar transferase [Bacilli bacterium]